MVSEFSYAMQIDDPIEVHILSTLDKVRKQNIRLNDYVAKSGVWAGMKKIDEWKPYDFFSHFETLFRKKYRREYRCTTKTAKHQRLFHVYALIAAFLRTNKITNQVYKDFIDTAFARHFTDYAQPSIRSIISSKFFRKVTGIQVRDFCTNELDIRLAAEQDAFAEETNYGELDKRIREEYEF